MITRKRPTLGAGKSQHSNMAILYAMANGKNGGLERKKEAKKKGDLLSMLLVSTLS